MPYTKIEEREEGVNTFFISLKVIKNLHIFTSKPYFEIIINSLNFCAKNKGLHLLAFAIMSNHVQLVFWVDEGISVSSLIADFKKHTAKEIIEQLKQDRNFGIINEFSRAATNKRDRKHKVWKTACHPEAIFTKKFLLQKIKYVDYNASHHGVADDPEDYPYTSFHQYKGCNHKYVLEVEGVDI